MLYRKLTYLEIRCFNDQFYNYLLHIPRTIIWNHRATEKETKNWKQKMVSVNFLSLYFQVYFGNCEKINFCCFLSHQVCGDLLHQSYETSIVHKCVCIYTCVCVCLCVYVWLPQLHPEMFTLLILLHTWDLSCYTTRVCSYLWRWVLVVRLCLTLQPHELQLTRPICHWGFTGKNTGVDSHPLLQDIFPTQGLTSGLLHRRQMLYHLSHQGSP